jgi:hypothetical protein
LRAQRQRLKHAHAAFVKQPIQQAFARQIRIDQLDILDGADQRLALDPGVVLGDRDASPRLPAHRRMQVGLPRRSGALGRNCSSMPPARQRCFGRRRRRAIPRRPRAAPGRDLFGAQEIFMRGVFEIAAVERHQALIAAHVRPWSMVMRKMALAEQRAGILAVLQPLAS